MLCSYLRCSAAISDALHLISARMKGPKAETVAPPIFLAVLCGTDMTEAVARTINEAGCHHSCDWAKSNNGDNKQKA